MDHKFWSGTFILLSLGVGVLTVLRWLQTQLNDTHPIALVVVETFTRPVHVRHGLYIWYMQLRCVCVAGADGILADGDWCSSRLSGCSEL